MQTGSLSEQYRAATAGVGWARVPSGVLRVRGSERQKWLHKIVTADVERLQPGEGAHSGLLDSKGHFVADFVVLALEDSLLVIAEEDQAAGLGAALHRYIFREKVQVSDESAEWNEWLLIGPESDSLAVSLFGATVPRSPFHFWAASPDESIIAMRDIRAEFPTTRLLAPSARGIQIETRLSSQPRLDDALDLLRIEAGLPRWGRDFDSSTLALEVPEVMSIRVDQGCYIGQEVVARLVHRGHVNRRLVGLSFSKSVLPRLGDPLFSDDSPIGMVTSAVESPRYGAIGLGYVRRELTAPGTALRTRDGVETRVVGLPFGATEVKS